jgi:exosome complex RNA-binding protein Rrp4
MSFEIDPVRYGQLWEKVDHLNAKVDKLEEGMEELLALANKGRGGFWAGMVIVSALSTFIGFISHYITAK